MNTKPRYDAQTAAIIEFWGPSIDVEAVRESWRRSESIKADREAWHRSMEVFLGKEIKWSIKDLNE